MVAAAIDQAADDVEGGELVEVAEAGAVARGRDGAAGVDRQGAAQAAPAAVAGHRKSARVDRRAAGIGVVGGQDEGAVADLGQAEAAVGFIEARDRERIGVDADDGVGTKAEARTAVGSIGQGIVAGEAADGAEAADAGAPDVEVLVEADAALQGEGRAFADPAHGRAVMAARAQRGAARSKQGARGDIGEAAIGVGAGEDQRASAVLDEAAGAGPGPFADLEHVGQLEPAAGVDRDAVVVAIDGEADADRRGHAAAGRDLLIAVEKNERAKAAVVGAAGDRTTVQVEIGDGVGEPVGGVHVQHAAGVQGHRGHVALGHAETVAAAEDPLVVHVEGAAVVDDDGPEAQFAAGGRERAGVDGRAAGVGVIAGQRQRPVAAFGQAAGARDRIARGPRAGRVHLDGGVGGQPAAPPAFDGRVAEDERAGVHGAAEYLRRAADAHGARAGFGEGAAGGAVVVSDLAGEQQVHAGGDVRDVENTVFVVAYPDIGRDRRHRGAADGHVAPELVIAEIRGRRAGRGEFASVERQRAEGERGPRGGGVDELGAGSDRRVHVALADRAAEAESGAGVDGDAAVGELDALRADRGYDSAGDGGSVVKFPAAISAIRPDAGEFTAGQGEVVQVRMPVEHQHAAGVDARRIDRPIVIVARAVVDEHRAEPVDGDGAPA